MKLYQIDKRVKIALEQLRVNDNYLLKNDLHEQSITHRLAIYIEHTFGKTHDVDCEYNKNSEDLIGRKRVFNNISQEIQHILISEEGRDIKPDIVIHKRGTNDSNLLVIEVKKSTNPESLELDYAKLKCYTIEDEQNMLNYDYGVFIRVYTNQAKYKEPEIVYFKNGKIIDIDPK